MSSTIHQGAVQARQPAGTSADFAISMKGITKTFGGVKALLNVDLEVERGEIHALLGGNGAGKSTLLKILRGVQSPDAGVIRVGGEVLAEHSTEASRRAGIAMIFQEMSLIPTLSAAQNIFLNREPKTATGLIDDGECRRQARALFEEFHVAIDPDELVGNMSSGQRQLTEIVKAISQRSKILVLDEPSSALTETEVELLFGILRQLKNDGVAIIYVSHRMEEIMRIADRATILRDGRYVLTATMAELSLDKIITHIVGQEGRNLAMPQRGVSQTGEAILELHAASGPVKPIGVDLTVHRGEVVGVAGLLGSGRSSLARLVYGITPLASGSMRVKGEAVHLNSPAEAIAAGIALIPENRLREGLVARHSVASNICLPVLDRLSRWLLVSTERAGKLVNEHIVSLKVKTDSPEASMLSLSGGNQQKVVLAKGLATLPDILVLDEPTAGIDIGSKTEIVTLIRDMAHANKAVLLISSEPSELIAASDRIVVMADGRLAAEVAISDIVSDEGDPAERLQNAQQRLQLLIQKVNAND
ncbi:MAG: sugar ABC transporter ATP-binding protein [Ancalomicrobiaceae bacterium]|nr:sugar ABC transporter ATP-binding protein [Ancalomicrobiaceae bacterium]